MAGGLSIELIIERPDAEIRIVGDEGISRSLFYLTERNGEYKKANQNRDEYFHEVRFIQIYLIGLCTKIINFEIMSTIEIKSELQQMIEREMDMRVLEAIRTILQKTSLDPVLKEKLTSRALQSEQDISLGKVFANEEAIKYVGRK